MKQCLCDLSFQYITLVVPSLSSVCVFQAAGGSHRGIFTFSFSPQFLVPPLRIFLSSYFRSGDWHVEILMKRMKRTVINAIFEFIWALCADDPGVYDRKPQIF